MTIPQAFQIALQRHQAGRLAEAEAIYRQILAAQPNHAEAMQHLGVIARQAGRSDLAVEWIRRAIEMNPDSTEAHYNLGNALRDRGQFDEAIAAYRRAIQIKLDFHEAHNNLGIALRERGQLDEAIAAHRHALQVHPDLPEVHNNLGNVLRERGLLDEAIAACLRALELKPNFPEAHNNLGNALRERGQLDEAVTAYRQALRVNASYSEAHSNLGDALRQQGQLGEAVAACRRALELKPNCAEAHNNLGNALREQGRLDDAIAAFHRALELQPGSPKAHNDLGAALTDRMRIDDAVAAFRRALQLKPDYLEARNNLGVALKEQGALNEAIAAFRSALEIKPDYFPAHSNLILTLHYHPDDAGRTSSDERHRWNRRLSGSLRQFIQPHANDRDPERRLRIGYVSPDFRDHVIGRNLVPLFEHHDCRDFEILCYAGVVRPDRLTEDFRRCAQQWFSTTGVSDEALAERIRRDRVDILVDLTQHLAGNRLPMFARKPAPVQVSFAGYPESTGLEAIEYRISDRYLEEGLDEMERESNGRAYLIDSFWCYDPCGADVEVNALPARDSGRINFGCLNNFCKVSEPVLDLWARVLNQVSDSRLVLLSNMGSHRQRVLDALQRQGVEARRVEFLEYRPRQEYLELYHKLDIVLDTFPYNGHTTSLDALWMGVPVVSLAGETPVSRAGLSQLSNLGLPEWAARSESEYVNIAADLARNLPRLAELRSTLRDRMKSSVLMDAPRFARQVEQAYREMWRAWCIGQSPTRQ